MLLKDLQDSTTDDHGGYCFLRVLYIDDMYAFIEQLNIINNGDNWEEYFCRGIKLGKWISILNSVKLKKVYKLYRPSYWGEGKGNFISEGVHRLTKKLVLMQAIVGKLEGGIFKLISITSRMNIPNRVVHIVVDNDHLYPIREKDIHSPDMTDVSITFNDATVWGNGKSNAA